MFYGEKEIMKIYIDIVQLGLEKKGSDCNVFEKVLSEIDKPKTYTIIPEALCLTLNAKKLTNC